jgi:superfamily II DNA or RNA helicase
MPKVRRRAVTPVLSRHRAPEGMPLEEWQRRLREEFGREQPFRLVMVEGEALPCEARVDNPGRGTSYQVSLRGAGADRCTCPDFRVSGLATCKHLAFARHTLARRLGKRRWANLIADPPKPAFSEIVLSPGDDRRPRFLPGAGLPSAVATVARRVCGPDGLVIAERGVDRLTAVAREAGHELRIDPAVSETEAQRHDDADRRKRIDDLFPQGADAPRFAHLLRVPLHPYQREGALFAARAGRALIADDMGLGKTIQAIAACAILVRAGLVRRTLIVCPASLVHQWGEELERFAGLTPLAVAGPPQARSRLWEDAKAPLKICTYDAVHRDLAQIRSWDPDLLILDEAQRIKNWPTRAAQAVKRIEAAHAVVLTGTPLENKLEELHSLVEVIDPHLLGPLFRFRHAHEKRDADGRVVGYSGLDRVADSLRGVLIRRTRAQVLKQLPPRSDRTLLLPLGPEQRRHHDENREIVARIVQRWRRMGFLREEDQRRLTAALMRMRMACDSTWLLDPQLDEGAKVGEIAGVLEEYFAGAPDGKVVLFSAWLKMHELVARELTRRGWGHVLFHGGVPTPERGALVQRFREDPACRVFLATDAGGVGLNLQCAALVVNADLPWNPAVLEQRIARVHRMGQTRPVQVVNLIAEASIESGILGLLSFKRAVAAGVLDGGDGEVDLGGSRLKRFMEEVERATAPASTPPVPAAEPETQPAAELPSEVLAGAGRALAGLAGLFAAAEVRRDAAGGGYLHLPLPADPARLEALRRALDALAALA